MSNFGTTTASQVKPIRPSYLQVSTSTLAVTSVCTALLAYSIWQNPHNFFLSHSDTAAICAILTWLCICFKIWILCGLPEVLSIAWKSRSSWLQALTSQGLPPLSTTKSQRRSLKHLLPLITSNPWASYSTILFAWLLVLFMSSFLSRLILSFQSSPSSKQSSRIGSW